MTRPEFDVRPAEPAFEEDQLARVVALDRMADELQDVADYKRDQRPLGRVAPNQKVDRQDECHRKCDQVDRQIARMQMAFTIVFEEAAHHFRRD